MPDPVTAWERAKARQRCAERWESFRAALGLVEHRGGRRRYAYDRTLTRREIGLELGISERTLQRFEFWGAPAWYPIALVGLANRKRAGKLLGELSDGMLKP